MSVEGSNGSYVTSFLVHSSNDNIKWMVYKDKTSGEPKVIANHSFTYSPMSLFQQFSNNSITIPDSFGILIMFAIK